MLAKIQRVIRSPSLCYFDSCRIFEILLVVSHPVRQWTAGIVDRTESGSVLSLVQQCNSQFFPASHKIQTPSSHCLANRCNDSIEHLQTHLFQLNRLLLFSLLRLLLYVKHAVTFCRLLPLDYTFNKISSCILSFLMTLHLFGSVLWPPPR